MPTTPIIDNSGGIGDAAKAATKTSDTGLGKDDFLKILMAQMSNMDPMGSSNQDPSVMTQQMTQFSILEQITNLNKTQEESQMAGAHSQAIGLIGHQVEYLPTGSTTAVSGTVKSVQVGTDGYPTLTIDETPSIGLGRILEVK